MMLCSTKDLDLGAVQCQAIITIYGDILSIGPLGTNFSDILNYIQPFSYENQQITGEPNTLHTKLQECLFCPWAQPCGPDGQMTMELHM